MSWFHADSLKINLTLTFFLVKSNTLSRQVIFIKYTAQTYNSISSDCLLYNNIVNVYKLLISPTIVILSENTID